MGIPAVRTFVISGGQLARLEGQVAVNYWEQRRLHTEIVAVLNAERPLKEITSDYIVTVRVKDCYL